MSERGPEPDLVVRPLDSVTWPAFARLVAANNGVWGGCWCMGFHVRLGKGRTPEQNRADKHQRVREGTTHAARPRGRRLRGLVSVRLAAGATGDQEPAAVRRT